jgi:hypothetical protein
MDGKSQSGHMESLDEAASQLGVGPLSELFSADPSQAASFMESPHGFDTVQRDLEP